MDYRCVSVDPFELERTGLNPDLLVRLFVWVGVLGAVASFLAFPLLESSDSDSDAGAIAFVGALMFGSMGLVGGFLVGTKDAARKLILAQPARLRVIDEAPAGVTVVVDRRRFSAREVQRIELHQVPVHDAPPRHNLALVLGFGLVELSFVEQDAAARAAALLAARLGLPAPTLRGRPLLRGYVLIPLLVIVVALLGLTGLMMWMMMSKPQSPLDTAPIALVFAASTAAVYLISRVTGRKTNRSYLEAEYELRVPG